VSILQSLRARITAAHVGLIRCKTCDETLLSLPASEYIAATIDPNKTHLVTYPALSHLLDHPGHEVVSILMGMEKATGAELLKAVGRAAEKRGVPIEVALKDTVRKLKQKY